VRAVPREGVTPPEPRVDLPDGTLRQVDYHPGETVYRAIQSTAFLRQLVGPRGTGKTTGAIYLWLHEAAKQHDRKYWPLRVAVVRDTYQNLLDKLIPDLRRERDIRGLYMTGLDLKQPRTVGIGPALEFMLFGMDTLPDANKFLGLNVGGGWIEEAAPAGDHTSGVPQEVLGLCITSLRQPGFDPKMLLSNNPPDEDHWSIQIPQVLRDMGSAHFTVETFWIPKEENEHNLPAFYYERSAEVLRAIGRSDLEERLVHGRVGRLQLGVSVTPGFTVERHVAKKPLGWIEQVPGFRFWDFGLNPTAILGQLSPSGQVRINAAFVGTNEGVRQLIKTAVLPWLTVNRIPPITTDVMRWRDIGDSAGTAREASNSDNSAVTTLWELLKANFEPGPIEWSARRDALRWALNDSLAGGRPIITIDPGPDTKPLRLALGGGWAYHRTPSGQVSDRPMKNIHCVPLSVEALTPFGWRRESDLKIGQALVGYDLTSGVLRETTLLGLTRSGRPVPVQRYVGQMALMTVTPEHRCLVRRLHGAKAVGRIEMIPAARLGGHDSILATAEAIRPDADLADEMVRLMAWVVAEGSYDKKCAGVHLTQSERHNPRYVEELQYLLPGATSHLTRDGCRSWYLSADLGRRLRAWAPDKTLSRLVQVLSARQARLFLYEFMRADGSWPGGAPLPSPGKMSTIEDFWTVPFSSPRIAQFRRDIADDLQALATLAGLRTVLRADPRSEGRICWRLSVIRRAPWWNVVETEQTSEEAEVWCPTTETGTWVAREAGHVFLTGNSHPGDATGYGIAVLYAAIIRRWRETLIERDGYRDQGQAVASARGTWMGA
jgi:hypothetical protein